MKVNPFGRISRADLCRRSFSSIEPKLLKAVNKKQLSPVRSQRTRWRKQSSLFKLQTLHRRQKRRRIYFKWKYRRFNWRFHNRRLWIFRSRRQWIFREVYSFRIYRRPHQPYRNRNILFTKNKGMFRQSSLTRRWGHLTKRKTRLISKRAHFKVFSQFYGPFTNKQLKKQTSSLRWGCTNNYPKRKALLAWFEQRLDVGLCRFNLAPSILVARHLIMHGYILVNKKQIISPKHRLNVWDVVEIVPLYGIGFLRYWDHRNRFQRFVFKNKGLKFKSVHQQKGAWTFGFWTRFSNSLDIPRRDKLDIMEIERLTL